MFKIIVLVLAYTVCGIPGNTAQNNSDVEIFYAESVKSYYQCIGTSAGINTLQEFGLPIQGVPRQPISDRNVSFVIYTRQHNVPLVANTYNPSESINKQPITFSKSTVLYVHGRRRNYTEFVPVFKNALLPKEDINLIFMNWSSYAFFNGVYTRNVTVPRLGDILAKFLNQYISSGAIPKKIFLIGVSSGAQALGFAGQKTSPRVGKILAIDPVGSCYDFAPASMRVTPGDADFVQIVHCSEGDNGELASFKGDVTFYMNGGIVQPQCRDEINLSAISECSHLACGNYVYETLSDPDKYVGVKCDTYRDYSKRNCNCGDTAVMGYYTPTNTRGSYYVSTENGTTSICG